MWDVIKVSVATVTILALATCSFIGFYLLIEWSARALARTWV